MKEGKANSLCPEHSPSRNIYLVLWICLEGFTSHLSLAVVFKQWLVLFGGGGGGSGQNCSRALILFSGLCAFSVQRLKPEGGRTLGISMSFSSQYILSLNQVLIERCELK